MPKLDNARHEAFAQARVAGASRRDAFRQAGYDDLGRGIGRVDTRPEVVARLAELEQAARWGGSGDLGPVIDELMGLAQKAGALGTAAGMSAARGLLAEAAKLKMQLDVQPDAYCRPSPVPELTKEEWLKAFAPNH